MYSVLRLSFSVFLALVFGSVHADEISKNRVIAGWVEPIVLIESGDRIKAKLDTGAKTSSVNAFDIERYKKKGKTWVRFKLVYKTATGEERELQMQRPLVRNIKVKEHEGPNDRRAVVMLEFCFAGQMHSTQFSLVDRSKFVYPVLLGRRFLENAVLLDPKATFLTQASCQLKVSQ